jgi:putative lipoprotein
MRFPRATICTVRSVPLLLLIASPGVSAQVPPRAGLETSLAGTTWQLVKFEGGDGTTLLPDVRSKYTISFGTDGRVAARIDCNRGNGTWTSAGANHLAFGPLAVTRAACPPGSLYNRIVRHWPYVRSYTMRDGHLFISLMADGGIYEFEPISGGAIAAGPVHGTATYRERIALPRHAVFEATLEDVSRPGAASEIVARIRNEQPGNPPIRFTISYDAGRIIQSHSYAVRARILVDDRVWFTSDRSYPILTRGNPSEVQLLLRRTSGQSLPARVQSPPPLENTYWKLIYLGNTAVAADTRHPEANIVLHPANGTVTGSGGCNRLSGRYTVNGNRLSFSRVASTMMACVSGMETEQAFLNAIGRVRSWRIFGQNLELYDDRGNLLARFEAAYLR